jgi:hypothetical protein
LSDAILNEYSDDYKKLSKVYKDIESEYSQINISTDNLDSDIISMIYLDMVFLSDEFIIYCLPILIPKAIEYGSRVLMNYLKKTNLNRFPEKDVRVINELINTMEGDERFIVDGP